MRIMDILTNRRRVRAGVLGLLAILACAVAGGAAMSAPPARGMISMGDCGDGDSSWVECEDNGGGGEGGFDGGGFEGGFEGGGWEGEGSWGEGGGLTPEEEEGIEIESGGDEGGGLTPEEEEGIEIESGDDGLTPQEREERAEERMQEDYEFEKEWEEEIEEEEKEKAKTTADKQQDAINDLRKKLGDEDPMANWQAQQARCEGASSRLQREQHRGEAGRGGVRELEVEKCFQEVFEAAASERCGTLSAERDSRTAAGLATTEVGGALISCLTDQDAYKRAAAERERQIRELQKKQRSRRAHTHRARGRG